MRWWKVLLIVMIPFFFGCHAKTFHYIASPEHYATEATKVYNIWVDRSFSVDDKVAIAKAIAQWNIALNGIIELYIVDYDATIDSEVREHDTNNWFFTRTYGSNSIVPSKRTLAFVDQLGGNYMWVIWDRVTSYDLQGLVMHEIAHLLKVPHGGGYLMKPTYEWEDCQCIDYRTAKMVAEYQHLRVEQMNYCEYN